jgi:hypothetical protein
MPRASRLIPCATVLIFGAASLGALGLGALGLGPVAAQPAAAAEPVELAVADLRLAG